VYEKLSSADTFPASQACASGCISRSKSTPPHDMHALEDLCVSAAKSSPGFLHSSSGARVRKLDASCSNLSTSPRHARSGGPVCQSLQNELALASCTAAVQAAVASRSNLSTLPPDMHALEDLCVVTATYSPWLPAQQQRSACKLLARAATCQP
jgi:hypothetical protein